MLASGSSDKTIRLWSVGERRELAVLAGHSREVRSVAFDQKGDVLASGSDDYTIRLWSVSERVILAVLAGHADLVNSVAFDQKGDVWLRE